MLPLPPPALSFGDPLACLPVVSVILERRRSLLIFWMTLFTKRDIYVMHGQEYFSLFPCIIEQSLFRSKVL